MPASSKKYHKNKNNKSDEVSKLNKSSKQPFKPNPTRNKNEQRNDDAVSSKETALRLEDDEPAFPRGGGSSLSRKEREEVRAEAEAEFEAEENQSSAKEPNKKKKRNALQSRIEKHEEDDAGSLFGGGGISGKLPRQANKITLKNVAPGMKLWGVVAEVAKRDIVISLPGGLRGLVRASDAFDTVLDGGVKSQADETLSSMFREGQLVACVVLKVDEDNRERGKRKIFLSLRLSLLNKGYTFDSIQEGMVLTAYVKSIEDHGYILDFGLPSFTGFLPKKSKSELPGVTMNIGQLAQGIVKTVDKTRKVVHLNPDLETVSKHVTKDLKGISIDLLVPGMMVTAGVQSTLENGVLFSFLTYFTGTVGIFHLQNSFATTNWQDDYSKNKKVNARILFIDPASRAIGLTLNQHLVNNKCPPSHVQIGDIYEKAKVIRVDKGLGLLLETPSIPEPTPTYVSKYEVDETEFRKFEKRFKAGSCLRVRILGFRSLEGVATGTSKANSFEGSVYTHSDAVPGMIVRGKIIAVDPFGAIVQFPGGIKAKCPLPHMSELEISKPGKKFVVGTELVFRVLGGKSKRLTVTHKKSLVKSKLPIISSYTEATDGLITHGWITKIEKHGCFVRFYNGIQGFASRSELEMEPGRDPSSIYHVGQVVKCRIVKCLPSARRINISFIITPTRAAEDDVIQVGSIVPGVVDITTENSVIVYVNGKKHLKGTIYTEHLADHQGQATLMKSVIKPGYEFDQLLLLDIESNNMIFSAKHSLIKSSDKLPLDFSQIRPNTDVHGYVCNIIESGCFVRFLGRLTGFVPRSKAVDDSQLELLNAFYVGQSVLSNIIDINRETSRVTLSLKRSSFSSTDASFLQEFFLMEEKIAKLQSSESDDSEADWTQGCSVGCRVKAKVQEVKDIGVVVSFDNYNDVLGYITHYQLAGKTIEMGSTVKASVLDLSKTDNLVDLSLKPELLNKSKEKSSLSRSHKKKRQREASKELEIHQTVNAIVEIVKDNYLVVSIPENDYAIGYVSILDYNSQRFPQKQFLNGQSVIATVVALPSPSTIGRLLLLLKSSSSDASNSKKAKQKSSYKVGSLIQAEITEIRALDLRLKFGTGLHGWVHITEINEDNAAETPFSNFKVGQAVKARIIGIKSDANKRGSQFELSMSPSVLTDSFKIEGSHPAEELDFPSGQCVSGYVDKVDSEWVWITITRNLRAQIYILDSSSEPSELKEFMGRYHVGQRVSGYVLSVNKDKKLLRLVPQPFQSLSDKCSDVNICEGCVLGGRVSKILPGIGGLVVKVGPHTYGRVHFTEIADSWVPDPLSGYSEGQFVKCKVLEIKNSITGSLQIDLSLRSSVREVVNNEKIPMNHVEKIEDLHPDMVVQGYIKNTTPKGCFIFLSRKLDARILLSNLSDGYVEDLEKDFPIGRLVTGRVLSTEPLSKRVEVTLKTVGLEKSTGTRELSSLNIGDIVLGRVKQVEKYGLFISIDDTNLVGLCHKSELLDDTPITEYTGGERVKAKVLKIDQEKNRVALGMKDIYEIDDSGADESEDDLKIGVDGPLNMLEDEDMIVDSGSLEAPLAQAESRAFVPPLEVTLDDINQEDLVDQSQGPTDTLDDKAKRRGDKKSKKQREKEIKIAEERLLEKDIPRTSEEFEKLVRGSPNSSFVWIKYMAFALSMAEVDKARSIAERALQTINIREENEKLNIWVAYFNLENEFGNPPEEAVQKVFQRALQYNDPKRVHLSLLGVYERTEKFSLADELVEKMTKKFKHSCKVWLRRVQRLLNPEEDTVQPIVNRALLSLPRHKHIKFISQTALLQYKSGVPHRGRTMFEGILREYPKRTDLWSMYIDQEVRVGDVDVIHALFERATCLRLPAKKMKFLFKKYLEYEKAQGDEERVEYVKKKAMEYVESTLAA